MSDQQDVKESKTTAPRAAKRAYLPAAERRQQIIEAAKQVFARTNLQGARTRDIAKAAEINQATLFAHFESKEDLFQAAVIDPFLDAMRGMSDRAKEYEKAATATELEDMAQEALEKQLTSMVEIFPLFTAALFSDLELGQKLYREHVGPLLKERSDSVNQLIKGTLDRDLVELAMFGIMIAFAMDQTLSHEKKDISVLARHMATIALTGAGVKPDSNN